MNILTQVEILIKVLPQKKEIFLFLFNAVDLIFHKMFLKELSFSFVGYKLQDLLESVVPFDVLLDRTRRCTGFSCPITRKDGSKKTKIKVVRDAEVALAALGACEEALDKELLISTS